MEMGGFEQCNFRFETGDVTSLLVFLDSIAKFLSFILFDISLVSKWFEKGLKMDKIRRPICTNIYTVLATVVYDIFSKWYFNRKYHLGVFHSHTQAHIHIVITILSEYYVFVK